MFDFSLLSELIWFDLIWFDFLSPIPTESLLSVPLDQQGPSRKKQKTLELNLQNFDTIFKKNPPSVSSFTFHFLPPMFNPFCMYLHRITWRPLERILISLGVRMWDCQCSRILRTNGMVLQMQKFPWENQPPVLDCFRTPSPSIEERQKIGCNCHQMFLSLS